MKNQQDFVLTRKIFAIQFIFFGATRGLVSSHQNVSLYLAVILINGKPTIDRKFVDEFVSQIIHGYLKTARRTLSLFYLRHDVTLIASLLVTGNQSAFSAIAYECISLEWKW